ncbi:serine hydrolase domain-containing protein [Thalassoroseus pseudoceratinae]|uniref:serine hydrolase domain-containing protein n=1 Tax=Thalassoroseus pseudoceratinae TaxID=2713176 RepID=UPI001424A033|nr:serine hydrolase domain-containing protein [Thalassoroseus pseudoceratinae]
MTHAVLIALLLVSLPSAQPNSQVANEAATMIDRETQAALESAIIDFMSLVDAKAATVAVSRNGKLLYSAGFGFHDQNKQTPVSPKALFRIASVSKPMTAAAIKTAIRTGKLSLDTKAFELLEMSKAHGEPADPRLKNITIGHLLKHEGGWDRDIGFDPMFQGVRILQTAQPDANITASDVVEYMWQQPLQFTPGEKSVYSNFGYCVLGRVLEKTYDKPFIKVMQKLVFEPKTIDEVRLGTSDSGKRPQNEVEYPIRDSAFLLDVMDAHGGMIASAPALCRFLDAYWISGEPREPGPSYRYTFFGSLPGTTAMARQRSDGFNIAVLLNARRDDRIHDDLNVLKKAVDRVFDGKDAIE